MERLKRHGKRNYSASKRLFGVGRKGRAGLTGGLRPTKNHRAVPPDGRFDQANYVNDERTRERFRMISEREDPNHFDTTVAVNFPDVFPCEKGRLGDVCDYQAR